MSKPTKCSIEVRGTPVTILAMGPQDYRRNECPTMQDLPTGRTRLVARGGAETAEVKP